MSRIIQDSDDEEDIVDAPVIPAPGSAVTEIASIAATITTATAPSNEPEHQKETRGTSSEEKLRRDIQAAHDALIEPTPSTGKRERAADDLDLSLQSRKRTPDRSRLKRTRTAGATPSMREHGAGDSLKTYASKKSKDRTNDGFGAMFENGRAEDIWDVPSSDKTGRVVAGTTGGFDVTQEEGFQGLPKPKRRRTSYTIPQTVSLAEVSYMTPADATAPAVSDMLPRAQELSSGTLGLGDTFATHNPNVLFPDSSSNLPSVASLTEASLPTSGTLNGFGLQSTAFHNSASEHSSALDVDIAKPSASVITEGVQSLEGHDYDQDIDNVDSRPTFSPITDAGIVVEIPGPRAGTEVNNNEADTSRKRKRTTSRRGRDDDSDDHIEEHAEDKAEDAHSDGDEPVRSLRSTRGKRHKVAEESTDKLNSDELGVGFPKEMYKPRPSRSRGVRVLEEKPIDPAANPSRLSKSKLRRRTTTGTISAYSSTLREMGFRSSQVEKALEIAGGDPDAAVDWLTAHNDATLASQGKSEEVEAEKHGKGVTNVDFLEEEPEEKIVTETALPAKAKEPVTAKKKRGRPKRQEEIVDEDELGEQHLKEVEAVQSAETEETEIAIQSELTSTATEQKQKGRGRPKKTPKVVVEGDDVHVEDDTEALDDLEGMTEATAVTLDEENLEVLSDVAPNKVFRATTAKTTLKASSTQNIVSDPKATIGSTGQEDAITPQKTPEKAATSESAKLHSPINKGRMPIRVGLNRRARVEPLLRMIKK